MRRVLQVAATALIAVLTVPGIPANAAPLPLLSPTISGPLASGAIGGAAHDYPFGAASQNLAARGYTEREYFFAGTTIGGPYTSRMIVRRPSSARKFSGTVYVEWLNVSLNYDLDALWLRSANQILRDGDAYIGIDAQTAGVNGPTGLKAWSPQRYGKINIPTSGSAFAEAGGYDIFAQALQGIRHPNGADVMGGLQVKTLIATGTSQSAGTMFAYSDTFGSALRQLVDGYLVTALSTSTLETVTTQAPLPLTAASFPAVISSLGVPVMVLNTETDPSFWRIPEVRTYRLWEVAGATHSDYDVYRALAPNYLRDFGKPLTYDPGCAENPDSRIPFRYAQDTAMVQLVRWARTGIPARTQPPFRYDSQGAIARDADGNALGGARLPEQAVPTATNRPENSPTQCILLGQSVPFTPAHLRRLYPTHMAYVGKVRTAITQAQTAGVLLPADAREALAAAVGANIPG